MFTKKSHFKGALQKNHNNGHNQDEYCNEAADHKNKMNKDERWNL